MASGADESASVPPKTESTNKVCYYELLNVERTATADQIRKAYLRASLKYHPDKNQNNPEAEEIFKEISEAYTVLSDEGRRERYDKYGFEAAKEIDIDPEELFEQMFGTRDPVEAFKKIMSDPELRGPVILGTGLAATVAGVATTVHGIRNKKGGSAALTAVGGLAGTLGGLTLAVGGAATWLVDAGIQGAKKGINRIDEKIDEVRKEMKEKDEAEAAAKRAATQGLNQGPPGSHGESCRKRTPESGSVPQCSTQPQTSTQGDNLYPDLSQF